MEIAIAQPNLRVGDVPHNAEKILALAREAHGGGARLLLLPRRALGGDPAGPLLARPEFQARSREALSRIREAVPEGITLVFGVQDGQGHDEMVVLSRGEAKVHREPALTLTVEGQKLGVISCDFETEALDRGFNAVRTQGAELALVPGGHPFFVGGHRWQVGTLFALAKKHGLPVLWGQQVGGNDTVVFEGGSSAIDAEGRLLAGGKRFEEDLARISFVPRATEGDASMQLPARPTTPLHLLGTDTVEVIEALCLGTRDHVEKSGFRNVILGLSGGIDSAVVAVLATWALGPERVEAVAMPSRYTSEMSREDAAALAGALGIRLREVPIDDAVEAIGASLRGELGGEPVGLTAENLQARVRGVFLMALSNQTGALVLNSGNKSEVAVGYSTLYGDMVGSLGVIADLPKTWVYDMARYLNLQGAGIPPRILSRPPSAELRPDQKDEDSLPPYETLDRILHQLLVESWDLERIVQAHADERVVKEVLSLYLSAAYKRRQAPPALRVTWEGLGEEALPLAQGFRF